MEPATPPIVLVPGFLGKDTHWRVSHLKRKHPLQRWITTHPGPMSSHHDRACEVFYSLKGGTVDYGECHSRCFGHARFGRGLFGKGLFPEWDEHHPIDCVGHSIGGVTLRVLQHLLATRAFPGHDTSAAWIRSVTALASPHNGDPIVYGMGIPVEAAAVAGAHEDADTPPPSPPALRARLPRPKLSPSPSACSLCGPASGRITPSSPASTPASTSASTPASTPHRVRIFSLGWLLTTCIHILAWLDSKRINSHVDVRLDHWQLSRRDVTFFSSLRKLMRGELGR